MKAKEQPDKEILEMFLKAERFLIQQEIILIRHWTI